MPNHKNHYIIIFQINIIHNILEYISQLKGGFILIKFNSYFFIIIFIAIFISIFFKPSSIPQFKNITTSYHYNSNYIFEWPLENNFNISSRFGTRVHPVTNKKSYHSGIDIPAKENTNIYSISNGIISYTGFLNANGYSIIVSYDSYKITYGHVSPNFIVKLNDNISSNQLIGYVGPKYLTKKTPYKSQNGYYLNGLTTGTHLHLSIKKDGQAVNPLDYL